MPVTRRSWTLLFVPLALSLLAGPGAVQAQDERDLGWSNVAELTFVLTAGNASGSTLGLKEKAEYAWPRASFQLSAGGIRTESGIKSRTATGTPDNFSVTETTESRTTAENYFVKARMDRSLDAAYYLYGGAGWDRNTFAGIQDRYEAVAGGGRTWFESDEQKLKTDLGLTYTVQHDVVKAPDRKNEFAGVRASYDYSRELTATTDFASVLLADQSLSDSEDFRTDWTNSVAVAMSDHLALKTSLQLLFDKSPALVAVPLGDIHVFTPLGKLDTVFTVAVVANF